MKVLTSCAATLLLAHGAASFQNPLGYGREAIRKQQNRELELESELVNDYEMFRTLFFSNDMSMSTSFSYSYDAPTTPAPSPPPPTPEPTAAPTSTPSPTLSPSAAPTSSLAPSVSSVPSASPTTQPPTLDPTEAPLVADVLFGCGDTGVIFEPIANVTTPLSLAVAYAAETTTNETADFVPSLEANLLIMAAQAALECPSIVRRGLVEVHQRRHLATATDVLGFCNATTANATDCFLLETALAFIVNKDVDPDYAAFLVYSALQQAMANYTAGEIASVEKLTYIAPIPRDPTPAELPIDPTPPSTPSKPLLSGWMIGSLVAMSTGGLMALVVWLHNRRTRHKRHVELVDEQQNSVAPVSLFSAERDGETEA